MENDRRTEQQLDEEQLQEITGGCAQCLADLAKAKTAQWVANALTSKSRDAADEGNLKKAQSLFNAAKGQSQRAGTLLRGVTHRHLDLNGPPQ